MSAVAFIRLTSRESGEPILYRLDRIVTIFPGMDDETKTRSGSVLEYSTHDGGQEFDDVIESFDDVVSIIARVVLVASAPAAPRPSLPEFDESTPLRDLRDCGLLNGHSYFPLARAGVKTVGDLMTCDRTFIFNLSGIGPVGRRKIEDIISRCNGKVGS